MNLLYKEMKDVTYKVSIKKRKDSDKVEMLFSADCGKFGTDEILDSFELTPLELLTILQTDYDNENK